MARTLVVVAVLTLCACPDRAKPDAGAPAAVRPPEVGPQVSVVLAPVAAGTRWQLQHHSVIALAAAVAEADGAVRPAEAVNEEAVTFDVEVLAAEAAEVTKARLTFTHAQKRTEGADAGATQPISGKSYVVEWGPASSTVALADGKPAPEPEALLVRTHADLIRPNELQLALAKAPLPTKVELPEVAKAFGTMSTRREDARGGPQSHAREVSARLEDKADVVLVHVAIELVAADRGTSLLTRLKGTIEVVKATGVVRALTLEGPLEMDEKSRGRSSGRVLEEVTWRVTGP